MELAQISPWLTFILIIVVNVWSVSKLWHKLEYELQCIKKDTMNLQLMLDRHQREDIDRYDKQKKDTEMIMYVLQTMAQILEDNNIGSGQVKEISTRLNNHLLTKWS